MSDPQQFGALGAEEVRFGGSANNPPRLAYNLLGPSKVITHGNSCLLSPAARTSTLSLPRRWLNCTQLTVAGHVTIQNRLDPLRFEEINLFQGNSK